MKRFFQILAVLASLAVAQVAQAQVRLTFHSFNGSVLIGRYPHTFISMDGTMADGTQVRENYGFSSKSGGPEVLAGPVAHEILVEKDRWLAKTNRHFTVPLADAQVAQVRAEVARWRDAPGKYYDLDNRNCIHFVGAMARIVGLKVDFPAKLIRKPRAWLNHITALNPQLGAKAIG